MSYSKYIAAGFIADVEKLFKDFSKCQNNDFKAFCEVWKKHKFCYIFMGRSDIKELKEFTNEIYQLTLNYMTSSSHDFQIAAIYLLYALYRNQIISPVKIRITLLQYQVIQHIHINAVKEKAHTLHYVIDYLHKHCLEFVANSTLFGPCCSLNKDNPKSKVNLTEILFDLKLDMTIFKESNIIENIKDLRSQHLNQMNSDEASTIIQEYDEKMTKLEELVGKNNAGFNSKYSTMINKEKRPAVEINIGRRRLELKDAASKMKVMPSKTRYHVEEAVEEHTNVLKLDSKTDIVLKKKRLYNKRPPVNKRRIGRPKKNVEKSDECESEESDVQYSFQILHKVEYGKASRKKASYLSNYEGPVILTSKTVNCINKTSDNSSCDELEF